MKSDSKPDGRLTIGTLASACGVGIGTVRHYQKLGLLPLPAKPRHGGFRVYGECDLERLRQIRNAQAYGFTLKQISQIFSCRDKDDCTSVVELISKRDEEIQDQIVSLKASRKGLAALASCCDGKCSNGKCPLFEKLGKPIRT